MCCENKGTIIYIISICLELFRPLRSSYIYIQNKGLNPGVESAQYFKGRAEYTKQTERNRKRKIIWYNRRYNDNVKTNVGKEFFKIIDQCFPPSNKLHKVFNRNTVKLSYGCMQKRSGNNRRRKQNKAKFPQHPKERKKMQLPKKQGLSSKRRVFISKRHIPGHSNQWNKHRNLCRLNSLDIQS